MRWMMAVTLPKTTACISAGGGRGSNVVTTLKPFYHQFREFPAASFELTSHQHDADGEDFLCICISAHVAKTNTCKATQGEVERSNVGARQGRSPHGPVDVRRLQTFSQLLKPALWER